MVCFNTMKATNCEPMPLMYHIKTPVNTHTHTLHCWISSNLTILCLHLGLDQEIVLFSGSHPSYPGSSREPELGVHTGATQIHVHSSVAYNKNTSDYCYQIVWMDLVIPVTKPKLAQQFDPHVQQIRALWLSLKRCMFDLCLDILYFS